MSERIVTSEMLARLPAAAQRYLNLTGVVGKPWIHTARVEYVGQFRLGFAKPWLPMRAVQFYATQPPGFLWRAWFKLAGLPLMYGQDTYKNGRGHMFGKFAGIVTLFDARGAEMDQGAMLRYLNEATWFPTALLGDNMTWQAVDAHSADVTFTDAGSSVSARLFFDAAGRLINFRAQRYREQQGKYSLDPWETPMVEYGRFAGLNLPMRGSGVWKLAEGDLEYIRLTVKRIEYNGTFDVE